MAGCKGVYLKVRDCPRSGDHNVRIKRFQWAGEVGFTTIPKKIDQREAERGYYSMSCRMCGHNDFYEDGINVYACNGCDATIIVL